MITLFTGTPGSGKTAFIVSKIMDELRTGRKIFTVGIPDLLLDVKDGGDPRKWHTGEIIKIDTYNPELSQSLGLKTQWIPRECINCRFNKTCDALKTNTVRENPDSGALLIIDEAHQFFPARPAGAKAPNYVEALSVHRHQGIDIWFVSQRPQFLDHVVRGLASAHYHIQLNPFSLVGKRNLYQWAEYQETISRSTKALAAKSSYSPPAHVFPLYRSASLHTKIDRSIPNVMKFLFFTLFLLVAVSVYFSTRLNDKVEKFNKEKEQVAKMKAGLHPASGVPATTAPANTMPPQFYPATASAGGGETGAAELQGAQDFTATKISSCIASAKKCQCYDVDSVKVILPEWECRKNANEKSHDFDLEDKRPVNTAELIHARPYITAQRYEAPQRDYIPPPNNTPLLMTKY